ncbi:MAG: aminotransferase class I/II-fold pyridoxal phosphate-dependent enzyme [Spirochaetaceae bacterium]|nr:MAG: aminotransferase class I/II-fold pyridoxal phosphate-dependent enzyme [Spirochaetaceae bacterium]
MDNLKELQEKYEARKALGLSLNIERGQPGDDNLSLSNPMLSIISEKDIKTPSGFDIRNYPGGVLGLPEARELAAEILGVKPDQTMAGNNASLLILSQVLIWALLRGLVKSLEPWGKTKRPKMIVTVPGYDRHFFMLKELGFDMVTVKMTHDGPDMDEVEKIAASDSLVKGILFVPTYSNPTGDTISDEAVERLSCMKTAAPDFTIFADDAYVVHHLTDNPRRPKNILVACETAGNPERAIILGSTSKITFSGAGMGFLAASKGSLAYISRLFGAQYIGPNKAEQLRHVKFLRQYPGGISGIMRDHARLLKPKFDAVQRILERELGGKGLASWTRPQGGYFVSLDTELPIANRAVELCKQAGVAITPAGATFPEGIDPQNCNIRIAPTRPCLAELEKAMEILALCIRFASAEYGKSEKIKK